MSVTCFAVEYSVVRVLQAYFFTADEVRRLFGACGLVEQVVEFEERDMHNVKEGKAWRRRWIQAVFRKPPKGATHSTLQAEAAH